MAEFTEVMKQAARMCKSYSTVDCESGKCGLMKDCVCVMDHVPSMTDKYSSEIERIVMDWAAKHPEPRYPSWKEAWGQLFPNMTEKLPPCPRYFVERERYRMLCSGSQCDNCLDRPIFADIAEKLGIKPIGGDENG